MSEQVDQKDIETVFDTTLGEFTSLVERMAGVDGPYNEVLQKQIDNTAKIFVASIEENDRAVWRLLYVNINAAAATVAIFRKGGVTG